MEWDKDAADFVARKADIRRRGVDALFDTHRQVVELRSLSESPIEDLMLHALSLIEVPLAETGHQSVGGCLTFLMPGDIPRLNLENHDPLPAVREYAFLFQQAKIGSFRVDFLILAKLPIGGLYRIVVECDGHEFHERTKDQAERDRSRDRALQLQGYRVVRFTGREIWRDALACAFEVERLIQHLELSAIYDEQG